MAPLPRKSASAPATLKAPTASGKAPSKGGGAASHKASGGITVWSANRVATAIAGDTSQIEIKSVFNNADLTQMRGVIKPNAGGHAPRAITPESLLRLSDEEFEQLARCRERAKGHQSDSVFSHCVRLVSSLFAPAPTKPVAGEMD